jgi:hypothetical protein
MAVIIVFLVARWGLSVGVDGDAVFGVEMAPTGERTLQRARRPLVRAGFAGHRKLTRSAAYTSAMFSETRYALNGDLRVAYRASREGPRDIVFVSP